MNEKTAPTYLGDGLYAKYDGYHLQVYYWDGIEMKNQIFLDFSTQVALRKLLEELTVVPSDEGYPDEHAEGA